MIDSRSPIVPDSLWRTQWSSNSLQDNHVCRWYCHLHLTNHFLPLNLISMKTWHMSQLGSRKTNWLQTWETGKTECMLFDTSQRTKNKTLVVVHQHRTLSETNSYKYQGVQLDQNLNIKDHTTQTYKKVCSRLQLLKYLQPKLTTKATVTIYQPIILPLVTYCSLVTYRSESYMKKAKSLHSHANQIIGKNANQSF